MTADHQGVAPMAEPASADAGVPRRLRIRAEHVGDYGVLVAFAVLFIALSLGSAPFLSTSNLLNIVYENAPLGIIACAVTLVVVAGNFDLSLGAQFALTEVCAVEIAIHWGVGFGLVTPLVVGGACGLVNGLLRTKLRVNSFLATLATSFVYVGAATAISGGLLLSESSNTFLALGRDSIGQVQYSVIVFVALAAGIAGLIEASTTGSGNSNDATTLALQAIAAVAIGGTSIFGGVGSVWRTVVGVLFLALITNGMDLLSVNSNLQPIVTGVVIVAAVAISSLATAEGG
jgi:ribose transport system permease protein